MTGSVKMTTDVGTKGATTLSRMNFSGYVVHCCVLFSSRVRIRMGITFGVWLVSCYTHVFVLLSVVIVTLPRVSLSFESDGTT